MLLIFLDSTAIAFHVYLSETAGLVDGNILIFDTIVTNVGGSYSDISGTFTGIATYILYNYTSISK